MSSRDSQPHKRRVSRHCNTSFARLFWRPHSYNADASRPKHDKATVLGDALAMVCELREAISRMKGENEALHLEAREVSKYVN